MNLEPRFPTTMILGRASRRNVAEHMDWPVGAVEMCEAVDDRNPGWYTCFTWGGRGSWADEGYYGVPFKHESNKPMWVYGATVDELQAAIDNYPGPALWAKNRRVIAERSGWPDGAVDACEQLERDWPDWSVSWEAGGGKESKDPGFYANRHDWHPRDPGPRDQYGATPDELRTAIESAPAVKRY